MTISLTDPFSLGLDNYVGVERADHMIMWLMFQPTGGRPVPLWNVAWDWNGQGNLDNTGWHSTTTLPSPNVGTPQETTLFPQWTDNVTNYFPNRWYEKSFFCFYNCDFFATRMRVAGRNSKWCFHKRHPIHCVYDKFHHFIQRWNCHSLRDKKHDHE